MWMVLIKGLLYGLCCYVTSDHVEVWKYAPKVPGMAHSSHFLKCGGGGSWSGIRTGCEHNLLMNRITCGRCIY